MPGNKSWIAANWNAPANIRAGTTTRSGGTSRPPHDSFNLARHVGDSDEAVDANRGRLLELLRLRSEPCWLEQVHGDRIIRADRFNKDLHADGAISLAPGVVCAILTADCLPLLLCDRNGQFVAALHVGWRGFSRNIIARAIDLLPAEPAGLLAWIGPHISAPHYEVGRDVLSACLETLPEAGSAFTPAGTNRWHADLGLLVRMQLQDIGVTGISDAGFCTFSDRQRFYSYRRDGKTGRNASLIWMDNKAT